MTHLTPEATQALYADPSGLSLTEQLTAAYQRNTETGLATPLPESLATIAAAAVAEAQARTPDIQPLTGVAAEFATAAETSRAASHELFDRVGLRTPELSEFAAAGFNFARLGSAHEAMAKLGLEPELVFAPSNLTLMGWEQVFSNLEYDTSVNADGRIKSGGLWVHDDVKANWNKLNPNASDHSINIDGTDWQVLVVPGTNRPPIVNVDHNGKDGRKLSRDIEKQARDIGIHNPALTGSNLHPTIASYLTLQATKLQSNQDPLDSANYTWLDGEFGDKSNLRAPGGDWGSGDGQVLLFWGDVGDRVDSLGVRLPVWGDTEI